jgi:type IX secretion system PorP/SprF family membrane protein
MKMKNLYIRAMVLWFALPLAAQQDPQYNLYQFNQLIINPAYAGARDGLAVVAATRQQWSGFEGAPQTTCLSLHGPILNKNLGVGFTVLSDKMGPRDVFGAYGNVAYILKVGQDAKLHFGVNAGYNRYQFNYSMLKFQTSEAPPELYQNQNIGILDINGGLYFRTKTFFMGVSATHLTDEDIYTFEPSGRDSGTVRYKLNMHIFGTVGKSWQIGNNLVFAPTLLVKEVNNMGAVDVNLNFFIYRKLWLGAFYRYGYGPGALLQYYVTSKFKVGYSYDSGVGDASRLGGSHEVMIGLDLLHSKATIINPRFL